MPAFERFRVCVIPACDGPTMNSSRLLRGIELRYVLTMHLFRHGPSTITELVEVLVSQGFGLVSPPPKAVSDALRWERRRGRVQRLGRGLYGPGRMPRGTEYRIHKRVLVLRADAAKSLEGGQIVCFSGQRLK